MGRHDSENMCTGDREAGEAVGEETTHLPLGSIRSCLRLLPRPVLVPCPLILATYNRSISFSLHRLADPHQTNWRWPTSMHSPTSWRRTVESAGGFLPVICTFTHPFTLLVLFPFRMPRQIRGRLFLWRYRSDLDRRNRLLLPCPGALLAGLNAHPDAHPRASPAPRLLRAGPRPLPPTQGHLSRVAFPIGSMAEIAGHCDWRATTGEPLQSQARTFDMRVDPTRGGGSRRTFMSHPKFL